MTPQEKSELIPTSGDAAAIFAFAWREVWARNDQVPPDGDWDSWLIKAGRGYGKTRTGAEWCIEQAREIPESRGALVARTAADARDVMVEGESGIVACSPPWFRPEYEPSKRRLVWPNGSMATTYTAEKPDLLRGPQHHWAWGDEVAAWKYSDAFDQLQFGLRLGDRPRAIYTTTPRPKRLIRQLIKDPMCRVTNGSTYDNAENLPRSFLSALEAKYKGTTLGRQELFAELLDEIPGALWVRKSIDAARVNESPELARIVVSVDPAVSNTDSSDEHGIIACALGVDDRGYVVSDRSGRGSPDWWARMAVSEYRRLDADRIVAEANQGGDMVRHTIRTIDDRIPVKLVHASRGKRTRAEPVAALYEQARISHVGIFAELEDQMCNYTGAPGEESPDRMDALVHGFTELMIGSPGAITAGISASSNAMSYRGI